MVKVNILATNMVSSLLLRDMFECGMHVIFFSATVDFHCIGIGANYFPLWNSRSVTCVWKDNKIPPWWWFNFGWTNSLNQSSRGPTELFVIRVSPVFAVGWTPDPLTAPALTLCCSWTWEKSANTWHTAGGRAPRNHRHCTLGRRVLEGHENK